MNATHNKRGHSIRDSKSLIKVLSINSFRKKMSGSTAVQNMQLLEFPVTKVDMTPLKTHDCYNEYIYGVG
jgi:hypothetical protein